MAERETYKLVEERTISGRGMFKIPYDKNHRNFLLYVDVVRSPVVNFQSSKYNPDKSEYAKITWSRKSYVMFDSVLSYENQVFEYNLDVCGYLAVAIPCLHSDIAHYLDYLAPFVGAPPKVADPSKPVYMEPLRNAPDTIRLVCRLNTALSCKLYVLKYDVSCAEGDPSPKPPPDPTPVPKVPSDVAIGITPSYDGSGDGGDTQPYPSDAIDTPPSPGGVVCQKYLVQTSYDIYFRGAFAATRFRDVTCWGVIGNYTISTSAPTRTYLNCQGIIKITDPGQGGATLIEPNDVCGAPGDRLVSQESIDFTQFPASNATILNVSPA